MEGLKKVPNYKIINYNRGKSSQCHQRPMRNMNNLIEIPLDTKAASLSEVSNEDTAEDHKLINLVV